MIVDQTELPQPSKDIQVKKLSPIQQSEVTENDVYNYIAEHDKVLKQNGEWYQNWLQHFDADDSLYNDPMLKFQYHLSQVNAFVAWEETMGNREIIVAVIDQGIDTANPELKSNSLELKDVREVSEFGNVKIDHGNHTSGFIAAKANNGVGVSGIAPNITLMPINAWDSIGKDRTEQSTADAIRYAVDHGAKVISMSFGSNGFAPEQEGDSQIVYDAIKYAYEHNVVLVASVSNFAMDKPDYPARYQEVIAVGGINGNDELWKDSNKGADIVAPGENVLSLGIDGTYKTISGTSMAAPIVSGAAALILSKNPELSNDEVMNILLDSAEDLGDKEVYGNGRLNIGKALKMTPKPAKQEHKFKHLENKWYKDTVIDMYNQGVVDLERTKQLEENLTVTDFSDMIIKQFGVIDINKLLTGSMSLNLDQPMVRQDAFQLMYNMYQYLYGQAGQDQSMITFLVNHNIVKGRGNGNYALGEELNCSEALQLISNFVLLQIEDYEYRA
ncbi:S8 family peptidase [Paenibacillus bouchesdurhonensis]|uniref:S8 family peptidase n=1 Tax=Paenibacillus bouchesdurhonensis TaxID=1870990 RepID=UPI000DA63961|nr:S8 family serine peptidase [Paenibacillus bouchesdurhonensis]